MQVTVHADEHLLHQVFRTIAVTDRSIYEVQQPRLITADKLREGALFAGQERGHDC